MKKMGKNVFLTLIFPAIVISGSAHAAEMYNKDGNKIDLYGKVDARHLFSHDKAQTGDKTYARLGFKGQTQIDDTLTGYGQWEYNLQANNPEANEAKGNKTRLGFAGIKSDKFGSLDYGRNYGVIYDVEAWTDTLPVFSGDSYSATDNFMNGRSNGLLTYRNKDFFGLIEGLNIALQYQGKNGGPGETNNPRESKEQNGNGYGMSASYDLGMGIAVGAAYASSSRTSGQRVNSGNSADKADVWTSGIKYDANNIYIAAMYAEARNMTWIGGSDTTSSSQGYGKWGGVADKTQNIEIVAQYQFDSGLRPSVGYLQSTAEKQGSKENAVKYVEIGSTYYFNKNMSAYLDYKINLIKESELTKSSGINTDNIIATGVQYQF